ncbi:MAG: serine/threonine-protein kinase [Polyangiaceae bacterium]
MGATMRMGSGGRGGGGEPPPPPDPPAIEGDPRDAAASVPLPTARPKCPECGERFSRGSRFCAFDGARLVDAPEEHHTDPLVGQTLSGKYTVLRPIGEGGMGTVYEVVHNALDRRFALKVLRPEIAQNGEHLQRFLLEAKAAAAIGHPALVSVSDFGECEIRGKTVPFFVMELLKGTSLAAILKAEKTIEPARCARILAGCADALAAAHAAGVIHRDLKPDNVFVGAENETAKVLDFGVAKMAGSSKKLTKVGMVFGTPHYMSPELASGKTIDHRADIYALGVILYECLAGRVPFEADNSAGVLTKQIFANPEPIERVAPDASRLGALGPIVMRCLEKEPDDRFASMEELAAALRHAIEDPVAAATESLGGRHPSRRPPLQLREEVAVPHAAPAGDLRPPSSWTRVAAIGAAALAVLTLVGVSVRAIAFSSGGSGASDASATTAAPFAPAAPASAAVTASSGSTASQAPATAAVASSEPAPAPEPAASVPTRTTASSAKGSGATSGTSKKGQVPGVVDPWSKPKKPAPSSGVVDPWAPRK